MSDTLGAGGSSPLTRGKPVLDACFGGEVGLIPAHAGKTAAESNWDENAGAHPRSRGENVQFDCVVEVAQGSSPLTRGKRHGGMEGTGHAGLIPAHAGKTPSSWRFRARARAHPRSRGENSSSTPKKFPSKGSSPLTRGKRGGCGLRERADGLIPAHAGKTGPAHLGYAACAAHPRSRGENKLPTMPTRCVRGSSPLTRGKPRGSHRFLP